jgi:hypothetical protein
MKSWPLAISEIVIDGETYLKRASSRYVIERESLAQSPSPSHRFG